MFQGKGSKKNEKLYLVFWKEPWLCITDSTSGETYTSWCHTVSSIQSSELTVITSVVRGRCYSEDAYDIMDETSGYFRGGVSYKMSHSQRKNMDTWIWIMAEEASGTNYTSFPFLLRPLPLPWRNWSWV